MKSKRKTDRSTPSKQRTNNLYSFQNTRDVAEDRTIAKHGRLQGQNSRPAQDRSIGARGNFTNKNQRRGKHKRQAA